MGKVLLMDEKKVKEFVIATCKIGYFTSPLDSKITDSFFIEYEYKEFVDEFTQGVNADDYDPEDFGHVAFENARYRGFIFFEKKEDGIDYIYKQLTYEF